MLDFVSTRRGVLKTGGALFVTFTLVDKVLPALAQGSARKKTVSLDEVDGFLSVGVDGQITVYSGKVDLGTGVRTAFTQIVAEELEVPIDRVNLIQGDTALTPDQGPTWGSISIQIGGMQIRKAAATARKALVEMAAERLGVPPNELRIENGAIKSSGKSVSCADLVGGRTFSLKVDKDAPVKDPASYTVVGKSVPRLDIPPKATGQFMYMQDFRVGGMLHGRVVRPLAIGAKLENVDESSVKDVPGLVKVVRDGNFLGVVATTEWDAIQAARRLKATWSKWEGLPERAHLWEHVRATKINSDEVTANVGNSAKALSDASKRISASYDFAIHTHGSIGPSCAVVEINDGKITCWSASQATHRLRKQLAAMMAISPDDIRCLYIEGSGCYGRNGHEDAAGDAALLSRAVGGRPVRVQWMRADEHGWDPKGAPVLIDLRAGVDREGRTIAWESEFFLPDSFGPVPLVAAILADLPGMTEQLPKFVVRNTAVPYTFPNIRTVAHMLNETPLRWSWMRSPGRLESTFANECFVDELAASVSADPLDFRLKHLGDPRGVELLQRLAVLTKWEKRTSPRKDAKGDVVAGRGISYVQYDLVRTYVGAVAEIEVDRRTGEIRVERFLVVHDCGQIINPDGVTNQIEGNIIQTVSRTLKEEVLFDRSAVTSLHWATYPILTFPEVPDVIIELIDRPNEKPWGAGEPAATIVPSAISNAVFDALGVRLRSVPFTPAKVLAAIEGD
ncbi:xanthine dehydrogenase family protein molybdopterin-binding subunit [Bradyrhizobium iriomotense]|uniref:xanthine dehydrogenase family protein molybdopterin-binding subunit n=1 Tax=Bradyrhizobium iriomotense TaxID=441950 RepID=UPI001B8A0667|nr:molybdopterin cofactor-binding domain-containing protein [Bradyrhizobium iriomotense]MBR1132766.1 xanthine dehydrogenase family protein molybdopterin-binding subunit [Bradyrhizobium iriomotense]